MAGHNSLEFEAASELLSLVERPRFVASTASHSQPARTGGVSSPMSRLVPPHYESIGPRPHLNLPPSFSPLTVYGGTPYGTSTHQQRLSPPVPDEYDSSADALFSPLSLSRARDERHSHDDVHLDRELEEEYAMHRAAILMVCLPFNSQHRKWLHKDKDFADSVKIFERWSTPQTRSGQRLHAQRSSSEALRTPSIPLEKSPSMTGRAAHGQWGRAQAGVAPSSLDKSSDERCLEQGGVARVAQSAHSASRKHPRSLCDRQACREVPVRREVTEVVPAEIQCYHCGGILTLRTTV